MQIRILLSAPFEKEHRFLGNGVFLRSGPVPREDFLPQKGFSDISLTQTERVCMAEKILAIVVTYNRLELLKQCLAHLQASQGPAFDILAVDNASTDGSGAWLEESARADIS
jgi:hypothetical protein